MEDDVQQIKPAPFYRSWLDRLAANKLLRRLAFPLLRAFDRPITITNPFSGMRFHLLSYTHKGYWFHGRSREAQTMAQLAKLTQRGDTVFEVGGHIGYLSQFFAKQTGQEGQVHIFEPGLQNQEFLRKNIAKAPQCIHIDAAVSDRVGTATFYEENLGGFMNSLDSSFADHTGNAANQGREIALTAREVDTLTLDAYATTHDVWPQILKIDAEGAELAILQGAPRVLATARALMIEVSRAQSDIFAVLTKAGFTLHQSDGQPIADAATLAGNVFALRQR